ncbi:MAG: superoxide dismutase [Caldilinea sp. CFX5]|nr:superoxide dismutase [Caldilinea sp. CFX5]
MITKRVTILLLVALLVLTGGCTLIVPPATQRAATAASIDLPIGFRPEGIAINKGAEFFVGSLGTLAEENAPIVGGAIYRGDLTTGKGAILVEPAAGQMAVGLTLDPRTNYLFVAGGMMGDVRVYDAAGGELIQRYIVGGEGGFINDLAVLADGVYATDSFLPVLYRIPLTPKGQPVHDAPHTQITLGGDYAVGDGSYPFQANGIVATPDGQALIIVNSNTGKLYRVDPATGAAAEISLGAENVLFGDGLVLDDTTLYVVQNYANQIAVVALAPDLTTGQITQVITQDAYAFNIPTTAAFFGDALYVVNARFEDAAPLTAGTPDIDYALIRVTKVETGK